jgi:hypothetical protein
MKRVNKLTAVQQWVIRAALAFLLFGNFTVSAQFFYHETCRDSTGIFQTYGNAIGYTAGLGIDPVGNGWLRLVKDSTYQNGYVLLGKTFPSTMGITIEFDFKVWSPTTNSNGIADGFCVFLFDGDSNKTFTIGNAGGWLGYRNLKPAYLGIGIDECGEFSNPSVIPGGPGRTLHSIAVANANYQYVGGTSTRLGINEEVAYTTNTPNRPADATYYRRVKIDIEPVTGGMSVTVYLKLTPNGSFTKILGPINVIQTKPPLLRMGFNASTGAGYGFHEVRDIIARTPGNLLVSSSNSDSCSPTNNAKIITKIFNGDTARTVTVYDTLPAGYYFSGQPAVSSSVVMSNFTKNMLPDGRTVCTYNFYINTDITVDVTYTGSFFTLPRPDLQYVSSTKARSGLDSSYGTFTGCLLLDTVKTCAGDSITLYSNIGSAGLNPSYQWFINGDTVSGATDSTYTYIPQNGDIAVCRLISNNGGSTDTVYSRMSIIIYKPQPVLSIPATMQTTCSGKDLDVPFPITTDMPSSITWTRAAVSGITPATGSGSGNTISEALTNTTGSPITVTYLITATATANGCSTTQTVTRVVQNKLVPSIRIGVREK